MTQTQQIRLSLNEIEQLCLKAARGAGFSWGLAEEAGAAASWLVRHGLDGPDLLLQRLVLGPLTGPALPWSSQQGLQCPIRLGASLCDHVDLPQTALENGPIELGLIAAPGLLLPFLSRMATIKRHVIEFRGCGQSILLSVQVQTALTAAAPQLGLQSQVTISQSVKVDPSRSVSSPCKTSTQTISALSAFAHRTTVPASEASRAGAGAADRDGD